MIFFLIISLCFKMDFALPKQASATEYIFIPKF